MSYVEFLVNYFEYDRQIIYYLKLLIGNFILENKDMTLYEGSPTLEATITENYGSVDNYLKNFILKNEQPAEGEIIQYNILPQILGSAVICLIKNFPGRTELDVQHIVGNKINAPLSIFLQPGHYDIFVLSQNLRPIDKTYEKLEWYSKEILINNSFESMASAEIAIWNIKDRQNLKNKDKMINEYIDNLPFSDIT